MTRQSTSNEAGRTPTVRQREVLGRLKETFSLDELFESACHRYVAHTARMARSRSSIAWLGAPTWLAERAASAHTRAAWAA